QPTMAALDSRGLRCPSSPILENKIWREYLSKAGFIGRTSNLFRAMDDRFLSRSMIAPKSARQATGLCYASSGKIGEHEGGLLEKALRGNTRGVPLRRSARNHLRPTTF